MNKEITTAYQQMQGMTLEEQQKFNNELCAKLKTDYPEEYAEYELQLKTQASNQGDDHLRDRSLSQMSDSSYRSKRTVVTTTTAGYSIAECNTPTKFNRKFSMPTADILVAEVATEMPRTFLNIDDEDEVRRSKDRFLSRLEAKKKEKLQIKVTVPRNGMSPRERESAAMEVVDEHHDSEGFHSNTELSRENRSSMAISIIDPERMDASVQVNKPFDNRILRLSLGGDLLAPLLNLPLCNYEGCNDLAMGVCTFRMCYVKGCKRAICTSHMAEVENPEEDNAAGRMCQDCQPKADRAFWVMVFFLFLVPMLLALPGIMLFGSDTTTVPPALQ